MNHIKPLKLLLPICWTSQSCSLLSNWFSERKHLFIEKPMVIMTEPAVQGTWLLLAWI